jgi:hypothetical protein
MRWRLGDLLNGVSDVRTYYVARDAGWEVYILPTLHAKCYVFDDECVVGSANLTEAGIGNKASGNIELCRSYPVDATTEHWLDSVFGAAYQSSDETVWSIEEDMNQRVQLQSEEGFEFSARTLGLLEACGGGLKIYTNDFPWSRSPEGLVKLSTENDEFRNVEHDRLIFGANNGCSYEEMRPIFLRSKCWRWLVSNITQEAYFGEIAQKLHDDICDDPAPFRKDVKQLLGNLLSWSAFLADDYVTIDRPRHSQRIRIKF